MRKTQRRKAKEQGEQIHGDVKHLRFYGNCGLFSRQKISGMGGQRVGGTWAVIKIRCEISRLILHAFMSLAIPFLFFQNTPALRPVVYGWTSPVCDNSNKAYCNTSCL